MDSPSKATLIQYLQFVSKCLKKKDEVRGTWKYTSYEELTLNEGREFTSVEGTEGKLGFCFENVLLYIIEAGDPELTYCEGYAVSERLVIPIPHAWVGRPDGSALDVTWTDGAAYFGIAFDADWATSTSLKNGYYGILGNDWMNDCTLLKEGIPSEAFGACPIVSS